MALTRDEQQKIRGLQTSSPVQIVPIANAFGVKVFSADFEDNISGMIRREDGKHVIYVNRKENERRRRFSIAHELAHFLLHKDLIGDGIVDDALYRSGLSNRIEAQANKCAANLLMPWHLLQPCIDARMSIEDMAKNFNVSVDAMSIRVLGAPYEERAQQFTAA